ncbi:MAG: rhamnulokinase [Oscillospiraceae bacterium]|nr:rhamnulokinase [Oscillospiraceae bacterium]
MKKVLAFDFGASSGRAILGSFDGETIDLEEVHRFSNDPVTVNGTVYWDVLRLFHEIKQGILKARQLGGFDSIGIDTWGVDFALIDAHGDLLENPVHYRDARNAGMIAESAKYISKDELYHITGLQFMEFNTCFQLLSLLTKRPYLMERADKLLFMPDFFNYLLTGEKKTEYSIATTSQMVDIRAGRWSDTVLEKLGIPKSLLPEITPSGAVVGELSDALCEELAVPKVKVIAVCEHDTQSAVTAVPSQEKDFIFISSGTWSLFGTEPEAPIINETSQALNITNEGGFGNATAFLKNICGLWLIQESRRQWLREGQEYSYAQLEELALKEQPFAYFIDPDAPDFVPMGDMPGRVREFCRKTGQTVPETVGEVIRCIYESLAMKYRFTLEGVMRCTGRDYNTIHVVGGGTKDGLLCRMTAASCGRTVIAGPVEATVLGNIAVQLIASGDIRDVAQAREIIAAGEHLKTYRPEESGLWDEAYEHFLKIVR